jgi:hypothetical protein
MTCRRRAWDVADAAVSLVLMLGAWIIRKVEA